MASLADWIIDFIRIRQLNFALAGLLTIGFLVYQYWGLLFKVVSDDEIECPRHGIRQSRSRSRGSVSRSRTRSSSNDYKLSDSRHGRRGRKSYRRCPDCGQCNGHGD